LSHEQKDSPSLPDKKIPLPVVLIGIFEIAMALLGVMVLVLVGEFNGRSIPFLTLVLIYGAMGAGLLAVQEWARAANVILHIVAIPYVLYTTFFLGGPSDWRFVTQIVISLAIIILLTRPPIQYKFKTAVSKRQNKT
jgi:hypothetical protein